MSVSAVQFYVRTEHFNLMDGTFKFEAQTKKKKKSTPLQISTEPQMWFTFEGVASGSEAKHIRPTHSKVDVNQKK